LDELTGRTIGRYRIGEKIGAGAMGVVYRARDTELDRDVAIKVLPSAVAGDPDRLERFRREARAIARLSHPNILAIHDVGREGDISYTVTELLEGEDLRRALQRQGRLPVERALAVAGSASAGLAAAHARGIIHRDIKPANIFLTDSGDVKILDFGLARSESETMIDTIAPGEHIEGRTRDGAIVGTVGYMSPEQAGGRPATPASDVFSLGCVLYEMLTGVPPFRRATEADTLSAILHDHPPTIEAVPSGVRGELDRMVRMALEKDAGRRLADGGELARELAALEDRLAPPPPVEVRSLIESLSRTRVLVPTVVIVVAAAVLIGRWFHLESKKSWAREVATPEIERLLDADQFHDAFVLARQARRYLPGDPVLEADWSRIANTITIRSDPPGATISYRPYDDVDGPWIAVGETPVESMPFPRGAYRFRIEKPGYQVREVARRVFDPVMEAEGHTTGMYSDDDTSIGFRFRLDPLGVVPDGMLAVDGGLYRNMPIAGIGAPPEPNLRRFLIDRTEVTNRAFKEFVDAGGYDRPELWSQPFVRDGRRIDFTEGVSGLVDTTGRPGPATWELGDFPDGAGDLPVGGVSWYEAAAYCEFMGKSLPTVYHWARAALPGSELLEPMSPFILPLSNIDREGPEPVATYPGIGISGAFDMAGNVREWCLNSSVDGRYVLGGAWSDRVYGFTEAEIQPPWERLPINGLRCVSYPEDPPGPELTGSIELNPIPDFYSAPPYSDEVFDTRKDFFYSYDRGPLDAVVESEGPSPLGGREQWITINAGYGGARLPIRIHLPEGGSPPYQAVVWFPGAGCLFLKSIRDQDAGLRNTVGFLVKSGRAVVQPIYDGTYERNDGRTMLRRRSDSGYRELITHWLAEIGRTVDYLEQRPDIDQTRVAYVGVSMGAGTIARSALAFEPRFRAAILWSGGFGRGDAEYARDAAAMVRRITLPVLMINGRYDYGLPVETLQKPFFDLLGTPDGDKRHVVFDAGHWPFPRGEFIRENLAWLDKYLGPVSR